jgi:PhnB protein
MPSRLNPYLNFAGNARQAMEFYRDVLGGNLTLTPYSQYGDPGAEYADQIMHGMLETDLGFTLMGADNPPGAAHSPGDNISICLNGEDRDELRGYWEKLSTGGTIATALEKQMWGDEFGQCTDKFGITWLVNITQPQQDS